MMTLKRLEQYLYLKQEQDELKSRIDNLEDKINKLSEVSDTVRGGSGNFRRFKIEGYPYPEFDRIHTQLMHRKSALALSEEKDAREIIEIEKFISEIDDCEIRLIIRYRIIERLDWESVARKMGGYNSSDALRKKFKRFFEKSESCPQCPLKM